MEQKFRVLKSVSCSKQTPVVGLDLRMDLIKNKDGFVDLYFGPEPPKGKEKSWVKTVPGKGWFSLLRLYGPEQAFFDRTWKPGDFERIK